MGFYLKPNAHRRESRVPTAALVHYQMAHTQTALNDPVSCRHATWGDRLSIYLSIYLSM